MKLKYKLFLNFALLFFVSLNFFGFLLIKYTFNSNLTRSINSSLKEYSVIYSNIKTVENPNNLFITDEELLKIKSNDYLSNVQNNTLSIEFRSSMDSVIYSSNKNKLSYSKNLFIFNNIEKLKYVLRKNGKDRFLVINKLISFNQSKIYFMYINNITDIWNQRNEHYLLLLKFNIIFGILLLLIIYIISINITHPINILINNINKIIKGNYKETLCYSSDIKELNTISKNFNSMNNEIQNKFNLLKEQNESKQRFIENLTHEIRTPLTAIIGYSSLITQKNITDINFINNSLCKINTEGKRIESLTTNLVKLLTIDKNSLTITRISMYSLLEEIQSIFNIKLLQNNVDFKIIGEDFYINTDKELLIILISNFFDNAIKSLFKSDKKDIYFILNKNLTIKDTGCGISKEDLYKIFEPFYMADKSRKRSVNGFGLGLSICQKIIKLLNIDFSIESELNKGTSITLSFSEEDII